MLFKYGANINIRPQYFQSTAFDAAIKKVYYSYDRITLERKSLPIIHLLLKYNIDLYMLISKDPMQAIMLHKASYNRYYGIVRLFLRNGYKFESYIGNLSLIPLLIAY